MRIFRDNECAAEIRSSEEKIRRPARVLVLRKSTVCLPKNIVYRHPPFTVIGFPGVNSLLYLKCH
jgi:hypothetical protein